MAKIDTIAAIGAMDSLRAVRRQISDLITINGYGSELATGLLSARALLDNEIDRLFDYDWYGTNSR